MSQPTPIEWSDIVNLIAAGQRVNLEDKLIEVSTPLEHGVIAGDFRLNKCTVRGCLAIRHVTFGEGLSFVDTVFEGGLDLKACTIKGQVLFQNVECHAVANFEGITVNGLAFVTGSRFKASPNFAVATFGNYSSFHETAFENGATFISSRFTGNLIFEKCRFAGGHCSLTWAAINGILSVQTCQFETNFNAAQISVSGPALIMWSHFEEKARVILDGARVSGQLKLQDCSFDNQKGTCLSLDNVQVSGGCVITHIICLGHFTMANARILPSAQFGGLPAPGKDTEKDSYFHGEFALGGMRVDGSLTCAALSFKGEVDLTGLKISGDTQIQMCDFENDVRFNRSEFGGVFGTAARYRKLFDCQGAKFSRAMRLLRGCIFEDNARFYFSEFDGEANFGGLTVKKELSLKYARFNRSLLFYLETDPASTTFDDSQGPATLDLEGTIYARLVIPNERTDTMALQNFIKRIPATQKTAFIFLEKWQRETGHHDRADYVRRYHYRQARKSLKPFRQWAWYGNLLYGGATKYGTDIKLLLALAAALGLAALMADHGVPQAWAGWVPAARSALAAVAGVILTIVLAMAARRIWPQ